MGAATGCGAPTVSGEEPLVPLPQMSHPDTPMITTSTNAIMSHTHHDASVTKLVTEVTNVVVALSDEVDSVVPPQYRVRFVLSTVDPAICDALTAWLQSYTDKFLHSAIDDGYAVTLFVHLASRQCAIGSVDARHEQNGSAEAFVQYALAAAS